MIEELINKACFKCLLRFGLKGPLEVGDIQIPARLVLQVKIGTVWFTLTTIELEEEDFNERTFGTSPLRQVG